MLAQVAKLFSERPLSDAYRYVLLDEGWAQVRSPHVLFTTRGAPHVTTALSSAGMVDALARGAKIIVGDTYITASLPQCRVREAKPAVDDITGMWQLVPAVSAHTIEHAATFRRALQQLRPFVSDDASRAWACCIRVRYSQALGATFYATNNVMLSRVVAPSSPREQDLEFRIPLQVVDFLLSVDPFPTELQVTVDGRLVMYWQDTLDEAPTAWALASLSAAEWPTVDVDAMIDAGGVMQKVEDSTRATLEEALRFVGNNVPVRFKEGDVVAGRDEVLAHVAIPGDACVSSFILRKLVENEVLYLSLPVGTGKGHYRLRNGVEGAFAGMVAV